MVEKTDLLIIGAGCAGLSLALNLLETGAANPELSITIVDPRSSFPNDRTWCFWNVQSNLFEDAVNYRWPSWKVAGPDAEVIKTSSIYSYQHLPGDAFYSLALQKLQKLPNVHFRLGQKVLSLTDFESGVRVQTNKGLIEANLAFDSMPVFPRVITGQNKGKGIFLSQHFKGIEIEIDRPLFDPNTVTLMDFRVDQSLGIHFMYVLPYSSRNALVEATFITPAEVGIPSAKYEQSINDYLLQHFKVAGYSIKRREQGVIPMSTFSYSLHPSAHVYNIGERGGMVRPSTGYAFANIQQHSKQLAQTLAANLGVGQITEISPFEPKPLKCVFTNFLDNVFLSYLQHYPERVPVLFENLFLKTPPETLVRFLCDLASPTETMQVVKAMPIVPFIKEIFQLRHQPLPNNAAAAAWN